MELWRFWSVTEACRVEHRSGSVVDESCLFAGCACSESYNYDPSATIDDGSCLVISGGCSDPLAANYSGDACASALFANEDCQYTPIDVDLEWNYDITDGNMTIQISSDVVTFNGDSPPLGSLIGVFFDIIFKILSGFISGGRRHWNHTHGLHTRMVMFSGCRNCINMILLNTTDCMDALCDSHFTFFLAYDKLLGS